MNLQTAGNFVRAIAVMQFVEAILELVVGVLLLIGGTLVGRTFPEIKTMTLFALNGNILIFVGLGILAFALISFIIGLGLWKRQTWARVLGIVFSIISFFVSILSLPKGLIGIAINAGVFYILIHKDVSQVFKKY